MIHLRNWWNFLQVTKQSVSWIRKSKLRLAIMRASLFQPFNQKRIMNRFPRSLRTGNKSYWSHVITVEELSCQTALRSIKEVVKGTNPWKNELLSSLGDSSRQWSLHRLCLQGVRACRCSKNKNRALKLHRWGHLTARMQRGPRSNSQSRFLRKRMITLDRRRIEQKHRLVRLRILLGDPITARPTSCRPETQLVDQKQLLANRICKIVIIMRKQANSKTSSVKSLSTSPTIQSLQSMIVLQVALRVTTSSTWKPTERSLGHPNNSMQKMVTLKTKFHLGN